MKAPLKASLPQPTASFLVPVITAQGEPPYSVLAVQFRTKHSGGFGIAGERMDVTEEGIRTAASRGVGEELGVTIPATSFRLFVVRDKPGRDVRKSVKLSKLVHGRELPASLSAIPPDDIETHHCPDTVVYSEPLNLAALGVFVPLWNDPTPAGDRKILIPGDPDEVLRIVRIDSRLELPALPISDDSKLLAAWRLFVETGMIKVPGFLDD